ncbi:outer membrane lipoprotein-sorting protein [Pseudomonas viridiflava]|uniref:outer membrane lipoprotein-sorting protein n=1 Tax=Pseudomonas viridiflava TaxID=33069 RepID=UPI002EA101D6|nr:outer membrane lipoprotein-sorting protein [Pseudomonas viridiflava]
MYNYANFIIRYRIWVISLVLVITAVLGAFGAGLKIVIDPATLAPQGHPLIQATNHVEKIFGSKYLMIIGITPKQGDIYQPSVLKAVADITRELDATPGVVRATLLSLASRQAKGIKGTDEGFEARALLGDSNDSVDYEALKQTLKDNPVYQNAVVSADGRTAAILVELKERSDGFTNMVAPIHKVVDAHVSDEYTISYGGNPVYLEKTEQFANRINILFPIAILIIGLLHFEAFRTKQGLILPLVTALMAVMWGTGFMGVLGQSMDIFNSPTPILILAVAAGHAVQLLKRYYEEYARLRRTTELSPEQANRLAVINSMVGVGPVMLIAGSIAAIGFFSLLVFDIATIRAFGIFTGIGILSAMLLEMTFIPAIRSLLKPPNEKALQTEQKVRIWDRIPAAAAKWVVCRPRRTAMFVIYGVITVGLIVAMQSVVIDNASKNFFSANLDIQKDDAFLNQQLGGTNSLYVMIEGQQADAMKQPAVLNAIAGLQRFAETQPEVGKTLSIIDFLSRMHQAMNNDDKAFNRLPTQENLVSQYLLLYSMSGEPGDFDSYVDYNYQRAKVTLLLKTGNNAIVKDLLSKLQAQADATFPSNVKVSFGGDVAQTVALTETLVNGKLRNIAQVGLAIFLISALVFRSAFAGVIVLAPLALSVIAVFGVMGLLNIPLNIPNSLISAMAVGIGADYAIYMLYRLREQVRAGDDPSTAVRNTLATAGKASLFVATAVAGGYGVLALSFGYNVHLWLSMFIVIAMLVSVGSSLTLVPALALAFKPGFIFKGRLNYSVQVNAGLILIGSAIVLGHVPTTEAAQLTPEQVMQNSFQVTKVADSSTDATFTLINANGEKRVRKTEGYTKLQADASQNNMRYVKFVSPPDIKGTATLLIEHADADDDMWVYLPALSKVRRLSASNKRDSFVGTDFSYGDIIGHNPEQWRQQLLRMESLSDGTQVYVIESTPKAEKVGKDTAYSKMQSWVRSDNFVAVKVEFYDLSGQLLKRIESSDLQQVGTQGKWQPMQSQAENLQTGHKTQIAFEHFKADQGVSDQYFKAQALDR